MPELCHSCNLPADDEYHFENENGEEEVWWLCEGCCEFAIGIVEIVANIEEELSAWIKTELDN